MFVMLSTLLYSNVSPLQALLTKTAVYTRELIPRSRMSEVEVRVPRHWDWRLCDAGGRRRAAGSATNRLIGEVVQSRRRPLLGPSPG